MNIPMRNGNYTAPSREPDRRKFLKWLGRFSFFGAFGGIFTSTMRFMLPNVLYEPSTKFVIGTPDDFPPDSATFFEDGRLFLFRRPEGLFAISSVCTHLGCNVRWEESSEGFECPCHGSSFDKDGNNTGGPAPKPLKWLRLTMRRDRQLMVDTSNEVDKNFRLQV
jgi:cytochrome b6-f complex iron-sulfur subunit